MFNNANSVFINNKEVQSIDLVGGGNLYMKPESTKKVKFTSQTYSRDDFDYNGLLYNWGMEVEVPIEDITILIITKRDRIPIIVPKNLIKQYNGTSINVDELI